MELEGPVWEGVLPGVLRQLYVGRRTGMLTLVRGHERRRVRFHVGNVANAEANVREDRLGDLLLSRGILSDEQLKRASGIVLRENRRLGEVLLETRLLDREGLREALAAHVDVVLSKAFNWSEGHYRFDEEIGRITDPDELSLPFSTGDLILRASRSVSDPDVVRYRLGDMAQRLVLARDPLLRYQRLSLNADEGLALSQIDGLSTAKQIVERAGLGSARGLSSVFALLNTGVIEYAWIDARMVPELGRPASGPAAPSAAGGSAAADDARAAAASTPAAEPPPPSARPTAGLVLSWEDEGEAAPVEWLPLPDIDVSTDAEAEEAGTRDLSGASLEERRRDILETHGSLDARTHYQLLEVPPDASDARVREAYFRAAKRFHPDGCHEAGLSDLRAPLEAIFARLAQAYAVLRSPRLRAEYRATRSSAAAASEGGPSGGPAEDPHAAIARAAQCVARERFWEALPILEDAVPRAGPGEARLRGRVLLARIYARDAEWLEKAEEILVGVVQDEPRHAEALHYLGMIRRHCGRQGPAVDAFRKVVELDPGRTEAWRNLVELDEATPLPPEIRSALGR